MFGKIVKINTKEIYIYTYSCNQCGGGFTQKDYPIRHMSTHTGGKNHPYNQCGKSFSRKGHLARYMTNHTGEKQFHVSNVISVSCL